MCRLHGKRPFSGAVRATAADYTLVVNIHLVGMLLLIIARASVKEHISHIKEYTLGVGGIVGGWGNKGASRRDSTSLVDTLLS